MIKGRNPFPFETIALAVSFSPVLPVLLAEMKRLCVIHNSKAIFIHVGKRTSEKQRELSQYLSTYGFHDGNSEICWEQGDTIQSILRICKQGVVDLLIVGASDKEDFKQPAGKVTRGLATKAKCSTLIVTSLVNDSYKNIVVNGASHRKTALTILTAKYFAEQENSVSLNIVDKASGNYQSGISKESIKADTGVFFEKSKSTETAKVDVRNISLEQENYNSISDFAFKNNSDLLITHSSDHHLLIFDRISTGDEIEIILKELPCNFLIVHSRLPE